MNVGDVPAFRFDAPDGAIWVWSLAVDLRPTNTDNFIVLFHYTNILGFIDVTGSGQALLVSMENKGAILDRASTRQSKNQHSGALAGSFYKTITQTAIHSRRVLWILP
jgi:hypothetical protein